MKWIAGKIDAIAGPGVSTKSRHLSRVSDHLLPKEDAVVYQLHDLSRELCWYPAGTRLALTASDPYPVEPGGQAVPATPIAINATTTIALPVLRPVVRVASAGKEWHEREFPMLRAGNYMRVPAIPALPNRNRKVMLRCGSSLHDTSTHT